MKHLFACMVALSVVLPAPTALAAGTSISGTHGRSEIKSTCGSSGGSYYSNLDGYGCTKTNCDGKGGDCQVHCDNSGICIGSTPGRLAPGKKSSIAPKTFLNLRN